MAAAGVFIGLVAIKYMAKSALQSLAKRFFIVKTV
jgi:hypothetical protein